jgi:glycosyltransferase involved in cell wall biosynthesis
MRLRASFFRKDEPFMRTTRDTSVERSLVRHRLFYVVGQLGGGGLEKQLFYLLSALDRQRYEPGVAVWNLRPGALYASKIESLGVKLYPVKRNGGVLARLLRLRKLVREISPEVVHSYSFHTNFPSWFAAIGSPMLAIGSLRGSYWRERRVSGPLRGMASSMFPGIVTCNSQQAKEAASDRSFRTAPKRVFFVPNAVDLTGIEFAELPTQPQFEMVGIGNLLPVKNWEDTLYSLFRFNKMVNSPWRLRICGSGPMEAELRLLCEKLSLTQKVEFLGFRDNIREILAKSHVLISSSKSEGTPNALLESMAMARPAVHTAVGDVQRLIRDGQEGFLVPVGHVEAMAQCLLRLAQDRVLLKRMSVNAYERVKLELDPAGLVRETLKVYRHLGWQG